jgi:cobalt-zinc-cadmium efflux system outer membrane protein
MTARRLLNACFFGRKTFAIHLAMMLAAHLTTLAQPPQPLRFSSLREVETLALRNNLGLQVARLDLTQAQKDVVTAGLTPNPMAIVVGDVLNPSPAGQQYGGNLAQLIELGSKRGYRIEFAESVVATQRLRLLDAARQTLLAVRLAYYDVLGTQAALAIADSNTASYRKLVALNELRFKQSQIAQTELSRSELALEQAELQRSEAALNLRKAQTALLTAIGVKDVQTLRPEFLQLADSLAPASRSIAGFEALFTTALNNRPDLLAARSLRRGAEANQRLQEANGVIDVTVQADYIYQQGVPMYGVTAFVPIPVFSRNQGEREKALIKLDQADRQTELAMLVVQNELTSAFAEYQTRKAAVEKFRAAASGSGAPTGGSTNVGILARATSIKSASEFAYKSGNISLLELLDAVRTYNDLYRTYIDAVTLFNKSLATLDAATAADNIE